MVYLIDASVYVFRAYYSLPPDMRDGEGNPVHALYGFARFLADLLERASPEYVAVAFDASLATSFRNRIYPAYKANREPAPPDLALQFERCREICAHLGVSWYASPEYEADDIIGTLATRLRAEGLRCTVVTRDKDMAQLIREGDVYWDFASNSRYYYRDIAERFGVEPERYADYLALTGDAVDNIPGVPGVGPKTAAVLMKTFASLDALYCGPRRRGGPADPRRGQARRATARAPRRGLSRASAHRHPLRDAAARRPGRAAPAHAGSPEPSSILRRAGFRFAAATSGRTVDHRRRVGGRR